MKKDNGNNTIQSLAAVPSFADLDAKDLSLLSRDAIKQTFLRGETVFREGESASGLFIVINGWLKAYKISESGREQIVRFVRSGECLNEIGALLEGKNQASAAALENSAVWFISHKAIFRLVQSSPRFAYKIIRNLANRVMHLMDLAEDLSLRTVKSRLAKMLVSHSSSDVLVRRRWSTQSKMAARLGTVPDVINRNLRELANEGLIRIDRRKLTIINREGLEKKTHELE